MGVESGFNWVTVFRIDAILHVFGWLYALSLFLIRRTVDLSDDEANLTAFGTLVTLVGFGLGLFIMWPLSAMEIMAFVVSNFAASGLPAMIIRQYERWRRGHQKSTRNARVSRAIAWETSALREED